MRRYSLLLALAAALLAPALHAQPAPVVPACPSTATLDQLITAIDAAVSGPANKDRTASAPFSRLTPASSPSASQQTAQRRRTS